LKLEASWNKKLFKAHLKKQARCVGACYNLIWEAEEDDHGPKPVLGKKCKTQSEI
jgi:hypothetical protein